MSPGRRITGLLIVFSSLAAALIAWWWPNSTSPPPQNPFAEEVRISLLPHIEVLDGEQIQVPEDRGLMLRIDYRPRTSLPAQWNNRAVSSSDHWPVALAFYPRTGLMGDTVKLSCPTFRKSERQNIAEAYKRHDPTAAIKPPPIIVGGTKGRKSRFGYTGQPITGLSDNSPFARWTFVPPPVEGLSAGEYVYEIWVYPTARWLSEVRIDLGDPVVLKRGLLQLGSGEHP